MHEVRLFLGIFLCFFAALYLDDDCENAIFFLRVSLTFMISKEEEDEMETLEDEKLLQ